MDNRKLGMWVFLSSEFLFFGALITNYLLFKNRPGFPAPYPKELYDIPFTSVSSFVLLMSSLTMVLGHTALERDDQQGCAPGWRQPRCSVPTFLGGQFFEFSEFIAEGLTLPTNPAASSFYLLTGFHGIHVAIGVLMLLSLFGISMRLRAAQRAEGSQRGARRAVLALRRHHLDRHLHPRLPDPVRAE